MQKRVRSAFYPKNTPPSSRALKIHNPNQCPRNESIKSIHLRRLTNLPALAMGLSSHTLYTSLLDVNGTPSQSLITLAVL